MACYKAASAGNHLTVNNDGLMVDVSDKVDKDTDAVKARKNHALPSSQYFSILQEGYEAFGFDEEILVQARREAFHLTFKPESQIIRRASQPTTA